MPRRSYRQPEPLPPLMSQPDPNETTRPDPSISAEDPPQMGSVFLEDEQPDEPLNQDVAAFDRVQTRTESIAEHEIEKEYERDYNRRYVKDHGDHHGHEGKIDSPPSA